MSTTPSVSLNVCLLPPIDTTDRLVGLASQLLSSEAQLFRVGNRVRPPHLTLYMATFAEAVVEEVVKRLELISRRAPISCLAHGLTISANGYVEVGYNKSASLADLQISIATAVAGLRVVSGGRPEGGMSEAEAANDRAYGYKLFREAYRPHITLAAYSGLSEITLPLVRDFSDFDFRCEMLTLVESDQYGSVSRVLRQMPGR